MLNNPSSTYNYFELKFQKSATADDLEKAYQAACDEIRKKHPNAKTGTNYWSTVSKLSTLPLDEQFFLRKLTYRGFIAGDDPELSSIETAIQQQFEAQNAPAYQASTSFCS